MDYPATQAYFSDNDEKDEDEDKDAKTPSPAEKVKIGMLVLDSSVHPIYRGINKVGRIDSCSVVIDHNTVSKEHAEIEAGVGSKTTFITDLKSLNTTKLNDVVLVPLRFYQLQDGDVIRFGSIQAVFKLDENRPDESLCKSRDHDDFLIPETPAPVSKEVHPIIPSTPDLSIDRSSIGVNCSSDSSMVAGTQEAGNANGRSSPRLSKIPFMLRGSAEDLCKNRGHTTETNGQDISDLETQKNISVDDSDEENIFDMITQQSDIHDDQTQKFSTDNVQVVKPSRYTLDGGEALSHSIEDLETQKFSIPSETEPRSCSINDLETQKFPVENAAQVSAETEPRSYSINDLQTQKITMDRVQSHSISINDVETQKPSALDKNDEDSETDEEGMFEDSADGIVDMFDAPTQLITPGRFPRKSNETVGNVEAADKVVPREDEITERRGEEHEEIDDMASVSSVSAEKRVDNQDRGTLVQAETRMEITNEKRTQLNDSIESKLNHMFDDVNETDIDEPTQILTQHLEKMLECTQNDESERNSGLGENLNTKNVDQQLSPASNRKPAALNGPDHNKLESGESDDNNSVKSDHSETDETVKDVCKEARTVVHVPHIMSTQELFADLPAVNIFSIPSAGPDRGKTKKKALRSTDIEQNSSESKKSKTSESASSEPKIDVTDPKPLSRNSAKNHSKGSKRARSVESVESVDSKRSKSMKNTESEVTELKAASIMENRLSSKISSRRNPRVQKEVVQPVSTASNREESNLIKDESVKAESKKGLPLKKRGSSTLSNASTQSITVAKAVVTSPTIATRSNMKNAPKNVGNKVSVEIGKRLTRSRVGDRSKIKNLTLKSDIEVQPISSPRGASRRTQQKPSDTTGAVSDGEVTPIKKPRTLTSTIQDPPKPAAMRNKRKNSSVSDVSELVTAQNESLATRNRNGNSLAGVESLNNGTQSSLESQEIQAILGVVDQGKLEVRESVSEVPRYTRCIKYPKTWKWSEDGRCFVKPVAKPRKKLSETELATKEENCDVNYISSDDITEKSRKRAKPGTKKSTDLENQNNLSEGEPSSVKQEVTVANMTSRRKHTRNTKMAKQKNEDQDTPDPVLVKQEVSTPRSRIAASVRNKNVASRRTVDRTEKENVVEESGAKRGRRRVAGLSPEKSTSAATKVSPSPSPLRRGRSSLATPTSSASLSPRTKHKILFTGVNDPELVAIVHSLGGTVTEKPNDCTALVTDKVRRTFKFLCGMAMAVPIVSIHWLKQSEKSGRFLETGDFLLQDPVEEAKFKFNLRRSLAMATGDKLLEGYTVVLTPNTAPPPVAEMKGIIQACGGKTLARPPTTWPKKSLIISRQEDVKNAKRFLTKAPKSVPVLSVEFILTGILRHKLDFEEHKLEVL